MSLFRTLISASIEANLTKNESKLFMILLMQTLGYGKAEDCLTFRVLVKLTTLRIDHLKIAITGLIKKEMFEAKKSPRFQRCYSIPKRFLDDCQGGFFAPHLPTSGNFIPNQENPPEIRENLPDSGNTTTLTPTSLTKPNLPPQQPYADPTLPTSGNEKISKSSPEVVSKVVSEVVVVLDIKLPASLSESEKTVCKQKVIQSQLTPQQLDDVVKTYDDKAQRDAVKNPIALFHHFIVCVKKGTLILPTEPTPAEAPLEATTTTASPAPIDNPCAQTIVLPAIITAENYPICRTAFATLTDEQIDKVLKTFAHNETTSTIHNPTRLLLYFVNAVKNNTLTVPEKPTNTAHHPSLKLFEDKSEQQQQKESCQAQVIWVKQHCPEEMSLLEFAQQMHQPAAVEVFSNQ